VDRGGEEVFREVKPMRAPAISAVHIFAIALASSFAVAACALAQVQPGGGSIEPVSIIPAWGVPDTPTTFETRPNGRDFARHYPAQAMRRGVIGAVTLCCKPRPDRTLQCRAAAEWPEASWGFGEASVALGSKFRLAPTSIAFVNMHPNAELRVPILWNLTPAAPGADAAMAQATGIMSRAVLCQGEVRRSKTP